MVLGAGIGALGVAVSLLTTTLLIFVPPQFATRAARNGYIDTWSGPIMTLGEGAIVYGIPLLAAGCAYALAARDTPAKRVVVGFVVGGLVFGVGDVVAGLVLTDVILADPALGQSLFGHVSDVVELGGRLVVGSLVGVCGAKLVGNRREPDSLVG